MTPNYSRTLDGEELVWWHNGTGRGLRIDASSEHRPGVQLRLAREHFSDDPLDLTSLTVCRNRLFLLADEGLWAPTPTARTAGGYRYRWVPLAGPNRQVYEAIDDHKTARHLARDTGLPLATVMLALTNLTAIHIQAVQLRDRPPSPSDPSLRRLFGPPRPPGDRDHDTLTDYHLAIDDPDTHFDDRETTICHVLTPPHPALGDQPFGRRLRQRLEAIGFDTAGQVVEVGCGTGDLAAQWDAQANYLRVDLSLSLLTAQRQRAPGSRGVLGNATSLPLADASVDSLISNEVIADLDVAGAEDAQVAAALAKQVVDPLPAGAMYNLGAWQFVTEIARVLRPGGRAYVSEFGSPDEPPEEAVQLDHPEVSIHFGHLVQIGEAHGLRARLVPMGDVLGIDLGAPQMARHSWHAVRALAASRGQHLRSRCWTPQEWRQSAPVAAAGVEWVGQTSDGPGPLITRFWALLLEK